MADYTLYGGGAADQFTGPGGPGATASVWTAATGGTQVFDLQAADGTATDHVTADQAGSYRFLARTGLGTLWLDPALPDGTRYAVQPADVGDRVASLTNRYARIETLANWAETAEQAIASTGTLAQRVSSGLAAIADSLRQQQTDIQQSLVDQDALLTEMSAQITALRAVDPPAPAPDPNAPSAAPDTTQES